MGWVSRLFGGADARGVIGWVAAAKVAMAGGASQAWVADRGYRFIYVILPLSSMRDGIIVFDAETARLKMRSGKALEPIGVAACLDHDFRACNGQRAPPMFSIAKGSIEQRSGDAFALVFAGPSDDEPVAIVRAGEEVSLGAALAPVDGERRRGGPEHAGIEAKSEIRLRGHVPFAHAEGSLVGFHTFQQKKPGSGIVAVGAVAGFSVVVARIDPGALAGDGAVHSHAISAVADDGVTIAAAGLVLHAPMQGSPPVGWANKAHVSAASTLLDAGGTLTYLPGYAGPYSSVSAVDCKVVAVFPAELTWRKIRSVRIGDQVAGLSEGTLIFEGG